MKSHERIHENKENTRIQKFMQRKVPLKTSERICATEEDSRRENEVCRVTEVINANLLNTIWPQTLVRKEDSSNGHRTSLAVSNRSESKPFLQDSTVVKEEPTESIETKAEPIIKEEPHISNMRKDEPLDSTEIKREPKTEIKEEHPSEMTFQTGLQDDDEFYHECIQWSAN